jgi:hypothetical protein
MFEQWPGALTQEAPAEDDLALPAPLLVTGPDGGLDVRATVERLLAAQPGPDVMAAASALDPVLLDDNTRIDLIRVIERCKSWMDAVEARQLAALVDGKDVEAKEDMSLEVSLALTWTEYAATERLMHADELERRLPGTWQMLASGRLSNEKAAELTKRTRRVTNDAAVAVVEAAVLPLAERLTKNQFAREVDRAIIAADPEGAEERSRRARAARRVERFPEPDGQAQLRIFAPAEVIAVMWLALTLGADQLKATGQVDTLDQGRVDTALSWALDYLRSLHLPTRDGFPVGANITLAASTAAGLDNMPAELEGFGPITAETARWLLAGEAPPPGPFAADEKLEVPQWVEDLWAEQRRRRIAAFDDPPPDPYDDDIPPDDEEPPDGPGPPGNGPPGDPPAPPSTSGTPPPIRFRVLPIDPMIRWIAAVPGEQLDYGRTRRVASPGLSRHLKAKFRTCAFPTCAVPSRLADCDHIPEWANGGRTSADSMLPTCPHHNRTTRNRPGWDIEMNGDGTATLCTPLGRHHPIEPDRYWVGNTDPRGAC